MRPVVLLYKLLKQIKISIEKTLPTETYLEIERLSFPVISFPKHLFCRAKLIWSAFHTLTNSASVLPGESRKLQPFAQKRDLSYLGPIPRVLERLFFDSKVTSSHLTWWRTAAPRSCWAPQTFQNDKLKKTRRSICDVPCVRWGKNRKSIAFLQTGWT